MAAFCEGMILIDSQGGVFSTGINSHGQLGRSSGVFSKLQRIVNIPPMLAASCGNGQSLSLNETGGVWSWGCGESGQLGTGKPFNLLRPGLMSSLNRVSALVAGGTILWCSQRKAACWSLEQIASENSDSTTRPINPLPHILLKTKANLLVHDQGWGT